MIEYQAAQSKTFVNIPLPGVASTSPCDSSPTGLRRGHTAPAPQHGS